MPRALSSIVGLVFCAAACHAPAPVESAETRSAPTPAAAASPEAPPSVSAVDEAPLLALPADWSERSDLAFERALDGWLPPGEARRFGTEDLAVLERALAGGDVTAVRAAVLLARTRDARAGDALLARLERRVGVPTGLSGRDAADVVAAASFGMHTAEPVDAGRPLATNAAARLVNLGAGRTPHPDFCVRVECARSALLLGRDEGIPFLLSVLRAGTTAGRVLTPEESLDDLAWAQRRAAEALSHRAGTEPKFRPEASVSDRQAEAARLEALLPRPQEKKR
ncbi:MAG TPA: hypothetical protein VGR31_14930 [Planctomycetota bacterium]|nr:hypothetical protein [Planctomycetota bacterium]